MSSEKWLNTVDYTPSNTVFTEKVVVTKSALNDLDKFILTPPISHAILGDFKDWTNSVIAYPIDLTTNGTKGYLSVLSETVSNSVEAYTLNNYHLGGYNMGEFHYVPESFLDFAPYTTLMVWLPFYGFVDLNPSDIANYYTQFRLYVDYNTGQAQYVIGVNPAHVHAWNEMYCRDMDDSNTRIIATYTFQFGVPIPFGTAGAADALRNLMLGAINTVGAGAIGALSVAAGAGTSTSVSTTSPRTISHSGHTSTQTHARFNPETHRPLKPAVNTYTEGARTTTFGEETQFTKSDYSNRLRGQIASEAFSNSMSTLSNTHLNPSFEKANNAFANIATSTSIKIVKKTSQTVSDNEEELARLFGKPLGKTSYLNILEGYTEISDIHVEGEAFDLATQEELSMLNEILTAGIIL